MVPNSIKHSLTQHVQRVGAVKNSGLVEVNENVQRMETVNSRDREVVFQVELTLKFKVKDPQNSRELNQGVFHLLSEFGDSNFNRWWLIAWNFTLKLDLTGDLWRGQARSWHANGHTHRQTRAKTIPETKLASGEISFTASVTHSLFLKYSSEK